MHPISVITGILLASSGAISFGLLVVAFLFFLLADDYPELETEVRPLLTSVAIFLVLTAVCAVSFIGAIKRRVWRWWAQAGMWATLVLIGQYYWPK